MSLLKKIAARLPDRWQAEMKRAHFGRQIRRGAFVTDEPEFPLLDTIIKPGDWVIDIGANIGHYTHRFSQLVGARGRVIAFEPVPATFALLAANAQLLPHANVTLFNTAVSGGFDVVGMSIPKFATGLANYYEARLSAPDDAGLSALALSLDALHISRPIALIKIDTEGHERSVLSGMTELLERDHPILIVERGSPEIIERLSALSYAPEKLPGSPNVLFRPDGR